MMTYKENDMGVYIPNMSKPTTCYMCKIADACKFKPKVEWERWQKVADDCPLIEIVTCGECKWCDNKGKGRALICTNPYIDMDIHPLDFCSHAERRE